MVPRTLLMIALAASNFASFRFERTLCSSSTLSLPQNHSICAAKPAYTPQNECFLCMHLHATHAIYIFRRTNSSLYTSNQTPQANGDRLCTLQQQKIGNSSSSRSSSRSSSGSTNSSSRRSSSSSSSSRSSSST